MREISPELVLVDPELAARERLRLAEDAAVAGRIEPVSPPRSTFVVTTPLPTRAPLHERARTFARETKARLTPTLLFVSLLLNLVFAASLFAGNSQAPTLEGSPTTPASAARELPTGRRPTAPTPKSAAERAVLKRTQQIAATRAPNLVDPVTGQLANNTRALCTRSTGGSFLCIVRPAFPRTVEGLYVRYWPADVDHPAQVTWLGYHVSG